MASYYVGLIDYYSPIPTGRLPIHWVLQPTISKQNLGGQSFRRWVNTTGLIGCFPNVKGSVLGRASFMGLRAGRSHRESLCLEGPCTWLTLCCQHLEILPNLWPRGTHLHFALSPANEVASPGSRIPHSQIFQAFSFVKTCTSWGVPLLLCLTLRLDLQLQIREN